MVLKCCVTLCKGSYASSSKRVPVYKLPQYEKIKKKWISVIPRANLVVSNYTAVCGKNWPNDAEMIKFHGKLRPKNPFSVFSEIPSKLSALSIKQFSQSIIVLSGGNEYVILGWFSTDPLEKAFGKLREGSGGTYFITA